jgi:hypothetical protein
MKKYFCKYLPVEGEIKEGDICYFTQFKEFGTATMVYDELCFVSFPQESKGSLTSPISRNLDDKRPYKLFLCSRDISIGDKVRRPSGFSERPDLEFTVNSIGERDGKKLYKEGDENYHTKGTEENTYKVIGEISPEAVWVAEGMEFDEDEWSLFGYYSNTPYVLEGLMKNPEYQEEYKEMYHDFVVKIKCPTCKQFH